MPEVKCAAETPEQLFGNGYAGGTESAKAGKEPGQHRSLSVAKVMANEHT